MSRVTDELDNAGYLELQHNLVLFAGLVKDWNLAGFLNRIEDAHAVGPILDPTLYRAGVDKMVEIGELARALLMFQRAAAKLAEKYTPPPVADTISESTANTPFEVDPETGFPRLTVRR